MKKLLLFLVIAAIAIIGSLKAFLWFAMADKAHQMVKFNLNYAAQQMVLNDEQAHFDFRKTRISSNGFAPSIVVYDPILQANIAGTVYSFEASHLEVISSYEQSYRYQLTLPEQFSLYRSDQPKLRYKISLSPPPTLTLRSLAMKQDEERKEDRYLWDQFKLALAENVTLQVQRDKETLVTKSYSLDAAKLAEWQQTYYFHSPEIYSLIETIEALADGEH